MLKKLLKKDFQATARYFIPLILGFIVISVLCKILFEVVGIVSITDNSFIAITFMLFISLYVIYMIAFFILTYVFIIGDFYQTVVGEQGYLTHTLPVKTSTLINSKLLVAFFWQIVTSLLVILSFSLFAAGHLSSSFFQEFTQEVLPEFKAVMGVSMIDYIWFIVVCLIVSAFSSPLMFYASIALGHLFGKHRIMGSILSYLGIYSVTQMIAVVALVVFGYSFSIDQPIIMGYILSVFMWFAIIFSTLMSIGFYIITHFVFQKKLNLE